MAELTTLAEWGQGAFAFTVVAVCGIAIGDNVSALYGPLEGRQRMLGELRRALPLAGALAAAQLVMLYFCKTVDGLQPLSTMVELYLVFACLLPFLMAAGRVRAQGLNLPWGRLAYTQRSKWQSLAAVAGIGFCVSLALVIGIEIKPGAAVQEMAGQEMSQVAMGVMALWLMINAPWVEETAFRHFLVPALIGRNGRALRGSFAVIFAAMLFAAGHAGHMEPAWPKLLQTYIWGLALGWARVSFGTGYAVGLHLFWNLSAPFVAPFLKT